MKVTNGEFMQDMLCELERARSKFPENAMVFTALVEEIGELAKALLEVRFEGKAHSGKLYAEAVQCAVMAMRVATEGDSDYPQYVPKVGRDG